MKKNILFIVPSLCGGGAEKTVANLSNYLTKNYNVYIAVFYDTKIKYKYSGKLIKLSEKKEKTLIEKITFLFKSIRSLKAIKKKYKIDYSISFLTTADFLNVFSKTKNSKTIISIRNTDSIYTKNSMYSLMTRCSCKKCDYIVSISKQVKRDLIDNFNVHQKKIKTIYNPALKIEFGKSKLKEEDDFYRNFVVTNVGRLTFQKGQWHLIRAFSKVNKECPGAKLLILGTGELEKYLLDLVDGYGLKDHIKLLGFVDNPYDYISRSNCFVFSSQYEGLGNAVLESLACGVPVISTDCIAGPREILAPDTPFDKRISRNIEYAKYGVLVPVCDDSMKTCSDELTLEEKLMADAIIELYKNEKKLNDYKDRAIERSRFFSIEKITMEWEKFLKDIDGEKKHE